MISKEERLKKIEELKDKYCTAIVNCDGQSTLGFTLEDLDKLYQDVVKDIVDGACKQCMTVVASILKSDDCEEERELAYVAYDCMHAIKEKYAEKKG